MTLNHMLDRIESSVNQLHTITDSLAHDLRSPLTAIRGKLEVYLSTDRRFDRAEPIVAAVDELDRLTEFLNKSLDVAEAQAFALRLRVEELDLDDLLRVMVDLYEPCMSDKGIRVQLRSGGSVVIAGDAALIHRMIANLLDNELKHLPASSTVVLTLSQGEGLASLSLADDGPGFAADVKGHMFKRSIKGSHSNGHGLGLAFVEAVVHAHKGTVNAANGVTGGAQIKIELPLYAHSESKKLAFAG